MNRTRRSILTIVAVAVLATVLVLVEPAPRDAVALDPGGYAPAVPVVVGGAAAAAESGVVAGTAGSVALGIGSFATGFLIGKHGAKAMCSPGTVTGNLLDDLILPFAELVGAEDPALCNPYQFSDVPASGLAIQQDMDLSALRSDVLDRPRRVYAVTWDSRSDFGEGSLRFGGVLVDPSLEHVNVVRSSSNAWRHPLIQGCATHGHLAQNRRNEGSWYKALGYSFCGGSVENTANGENKWALPASSAPYADGGFLYETWDNEAALLPSGQGTGGDRNGVIRPGDKLAIVPVTVGTNQALFRSPAAGHVYGWVPADLEINRRGQEVRHITRSYCGTGFTGSTVQRTVTSPWQFENEAPEILPSPCQDLELPRRTWVEQETRSRTGHLIRRTLIDVELPPDIATERPEIEKCFKNKGRDCELVPTVDPENPEVVTDCTWGGETVPVGWCAEAGPLPEKNQPVPTTTVPPDPTVTTVPTTVPPNTSIPPSDPPGPPSGPGGGGGAGGGGEFVQWSTCMEDMIPSDWFEVTWNPVTWVRAIVTYMVAPIICAIWWLLVPPGGWGPIWDDLKSVWEDSPVVGPLVDLLVEWEWDPSECPSVVVPGILGVDGDDEVDIGFCTNLYVSFVLLVLFGLATIACISNLATTMSLLGMDRRGRADTL